ncbi:methyltransferase RsmF C-terminal domain-like protein [Parapedobacter sp. 10938]|uniref:methyltransferase RsmF C-terminal domain-like protein n=1 Tax=Parapedobacter flavus TaxID=3110225 RepID=UPI002DB5ECC7|nr:RNA methyltransferase [Parapedobacter sp. 10938]MEC3880688.1 RNA methyltransferase [Parapedobacter sp. 10938]
MSNILPPALVRRLGNSAGFDTAAFEAVHEKEGGFTAIRVNPAKRKLPGEITADPVPWCDTGYYLAERPVFTLDPLFHAGCYYVQEASSMFVAHAIRTLGLDKEPLVALDLCAAPGGKSTLLNSYLHADSLLIANELIKARATALVDNLVRWGRPNTVVSNNDPSAFGHLPGYVDLLLVDAPCSGSGMFHKDHEAINAWSESAVQLCCERQQRILATSLPALKEGGVLLYSTCSYSREEDEKIADWLCDTQGLEPLSIPIAAEWGIEQTLSDKHACPGYRFYPHKLRGEGFFLAAFRKVSKQPTFDHRKPKVERTTVPALKKWVSGIDDYCTFTIGEDIHILPKRWETDLHILRNMLYLRNAGTYVGWLANGDLIPAHDLALSLVRRPDIPTVALAEDEALHYLRKGSLPPTINKHGIRGWALAAYEGVALGWMKVLPNRINNYYPKVWRIATM